MKLIFKYFIESIKAFPYYYLIALFYTLVCSLIIAIIPFGLEKLINFIELKDIILCLFLIFVILFFMIVSIFLEIKWYISLDVFGGKYISNLLVRCQQHLINSQENVIEREVGGSISHILYADILNIFRTIGHQLPSLTGSILIVLILFLFAYFIHTQIMFLMLISSLIGFIISLISRHVIQSQTSITNNYLKKLHEHIDDFVKSINFVKINLLNNYYTNKTERYVANFIDSSIKEDQKIYFFSGLIRKTNLTIQVLFSLTLSIFVANNSTSIIIYTMIFSLLMSEINKIETLLQQIYRSIICFDNVNNILNLSNENGDILIDNINKIEVAIDNYCHFKWENNSNILNNITFSLEKGDIVLLKGNNGCGKSTLIKILCGLIKDGVNSVIKVNDNLIDSLDLSSYFSRIIYIDQNDYFVNDTVENYLLNILPENKFDISDIDDLLKRLNLNINLNEKLNDVNPKLYGGERKKIQLLRLLLKLDYVDINILDEVDAGLDIETKEMYISIINSLIEKQNKIIIVVQHSKDIGFEFNKNISL